MANTLIHRGPDDSGNWSDPLNGLALGFRRLAIVDLSPHGHQPMCSASGRYVTVFNGEIYNFRALRDVLEGEQNRFKGGSDTEVLLAAVEHWGVERAVSKFVGMFAIALWDRQERCLWLIRDRLGKKPLYYGCMEGSLLFGSELKALRTHRDFRSDIDRESLSNYVRFGAVSAPSTIYRGINQLPPGCLIRIDNPREILPTPKSYWTMAGVVEQGMGNPFSGSEEEAIECLEELLQESIRLRMIADVPLGAFLSGGIDSSTVVALMQVQSRRPVKTFSIGFCEDEYNEARHAKRVADYLGTEHTELYVTSAEALAVIPKLPEIFDEPFADSSQIPTFLLAKLTRGSVTVSLSGDGGDELFGGYDRYALTEKIWSRMNWIPAVSRRQIARALKGIMIAGIETPYLQRVSGAFGLPSHDALYEYILSHWKSPSEVVIGGNGAATVMSECSRWPTHCSATERMLFFDSVSYLPDDILTKVDRASMAVSLEARVPLLDHRIVEFAWRLPSSLKSRNGQGKWILRKLLHKYVPQSLVERPKMGFGIPLGAWLRGPLRDWAEELLSEQRLRDGGYFFSKPIRKAWNDHISSRANREYCLWDILMFQSWLEHWESGRVHQDSPVPVHIEESKQLHDGIESTQVPESQTGENVVPVRSGTEH